MRVTGISDINFRAGFSTQPSLDLNHTIEWPLQGARSWGCLLRGGAGLWEAGGALGADWERTAAEQVAQAGFPHRRARPSSGDIVTISL